MAWGVEDYCAVAASHAVTLHTWEEFVRTVLVDRWLLEYDDQSPWSPQVMEVDQGAMTFLFDAAASMGPQRGQPADDRVVAVWGRSAPPAVTRDRARMAGFIPVPAVWSGRARDRGHFVAHALGGGVDLNLFPQSAALNRGRSAAGRRWRALERAACSRPGTPLFVRPSYNDETWVPDTLDYGLFIDGELRVERFDNR